MPEKHCRHQQSKASMQALRELCAHIHVNRACQ